MNIYLLGKLESGLDRGQSPVQWGDFPSVYLYICPSTKSRAWLAGPQARLIGSASGLAGKPEALARKASGLVGRASALAGWPSGVGERYGQAKVNGMAFWTPGPSSFIIPPCG